MTAFYVGQKLRASRVNQLSNSGIFESLGGCSLTTTSATYVDITGATTTFTKLGGATESDMIIRVSLSLFVTSANTGVKIGVNVNSTDNDALIITINTANAHSTLPTGTVRITALAAGAYTVKLRALRNGGAGTLSIDTSDSVSMDIREQVI